MMKKASFAMKFQTVLLLLLLVSFLLLMQTANETAFRVGAVALIFLSLLQIAVGNIDLGYNGKRWVKALLKIFAIVVAVFGTSMLIIPLFLNKQFVMAFLWALIVGTVAMFALFIGLGTRKPKPTAGGEQYGCDH